MRAGAFLVPLLLPAAAEVVGLNRANWFEHVSGLHDWYIVFSQQGCPHCERLAPMWTVLEQQLAGEGAGVRLGKVDVSQDNGIALTFGVRRGYRAP